MSLMINTYAGYWRDTAREFRLGPFSGYLFMPLMTFFMHIEVWTAAVLLVSGVLAVILERFGYTIPVMLLVLRSKIAGARVSAVPKIGQRRFFK